MAHSTSDSIFNRLQLFRRSSENPDEPRIDPSTSRVKRCLFGRGNPQENIKFAKAELQKSLADSKKKWNFDFENEVPIEGRFKWETPAPYPKVLLKKPDENRNPLSKDHTSTSDENQASSSSSDSNTESSVSSANQRATSRQSSINREF